MVIRRRLAKQWSTREPSLKKLLAGRTVWIVTLSTHMHTEKELGKYSQNIRSRYAYTGVAPSKDEEALGSYYTNQHRGMVA